MMETKNLFYASLTPSLKMSNSLYCQIRLQRRFYIVGFVAMASLSSLSRIRVKNLQIKWPLTCSTRCESNIPRLPATILNATARRRSATRPSLSTWQPPSTRPPRIGNLMFRHWPSPTIPVSTILSRPLLSASPLGWRLGSPLSLRPNFNVYMATAVQMDRLLDSSLPGNLLFGPTSRPRPSRRNILTKRLLTMTIMRVNLS
jgi:hypothetical protein